MLIAQCLCAMSFQEAQLGNRSLEAGVLCLDQGWPHKSIATFEDFDDAAQWPQIAWRRFIGDENDVVNTKASCRLEPLLTMLDAAEVLTYPPKPKPIG